MKLVLTRDIFGPEFTLGSLSVDGKPFCYTCEDKVRELPGVPVADWKIDKVTAIPVGTYKVMVNMSTKFKRRMPLLEGVPGFSGVRLHGGNTHINTEGCPLVAAHRDIATGRVWQSMEAVLTQIIQAAINRGEKVTIEVKNGVNI